MAAGRIGYHRIPGISQIISDKQDGESQKYHEYPLSLIGQKSHSCHEYVRAGINEF
jgi:hypothetical protein